MSVVALKTEGFVAVFAIEVVYFLEQTVEFIAPGVRVVLPDVVI